MRLALILALAAPLSACDIPTPLAPAEPIGEVPTWGEGFATPTEAQQSALGLVNGSQGPGGAGEWSGGDATLGKGVYTALCVRCHGVIGEGGSVPGIGAVPALSDADLQTRLGDRELARSIVLGKGGMPSFMDELDKDKLRGVVAFIRTLKQSK